MSTSFLTTGDTCRQALAQWQAIQGIGKKPRTQNYHAELVATILANCDFAGVTPRCVTETDVTALVIALAHYSAPRFNAMLAALKVTLPAARSHKRRRVTVKERPILDQLQFNRLLAELDRRPRSQAGLVIRLLAHTGLRINEARQLRWSDVLADSILVPGSIAKNGKGRSIPFVNGIIEVLDRLRALGGHGAVLPQAACKRSLHTACERAALPYLSHHDFRHLFATRCIVSGVDLPTVARWLGHSDGGALLGRVYFHLADAHSRSMAKRVMI